MITDHFRELALTRNSRLEQILQTSSGPSLESLVGFEWRGHNMSWLIKLLRLQKFVKGFFLDGASVEGYNVPVLQNGLDGAWCQQPTPENPKHYAFYRMTQVDRQAVDNLYAKAILLDYGANPRNPTYGLERLLRDYVVQPDPENPDLLLGKAYIAFGPYRIPSNFFVLERLRRIIVDP